MGLLDIKPHQVSRDLRGYSVMMYGAPKTGKTTTDVNSQEHCFWRLKKVIVQFLAYMLFL